MRVEHRRRTWDDRDSLRVEKGVLAMRIASLLRGKGDFVATVSPMASVAEVLERLAELGIGALVVSADGSTIDGIISERDVVRRLHTDGPATLGFPVVDVMTADVTTCTPDDDVDAIMQLMTEARVRHIPVTVADRLVGIVSIGDVVKVKMGELQKERDALMEYIATGR
jgi:CBS domain-containing protein